TTNELGVIIRDVREPQSLDEILGLATAKPALVSPGLDAELDRVNPRKRRITIRNAGLSPQLTRMGIADFSKSKLPLKDSHVIITDVRSAAAICFPDRPENVHQIGVTVSQGADVEQVRKRVQEVVGDEADVQTIDASRNLVSDVTAGLELGLTVGSAVALVVGLFLVYNILSVIVAERRQD